jgi:hypothetical protein
MKQILLMKNEGFEALVALEINLENRIGRNRFVRTDDLRDPTESNNSESTVKARPIRTKRVTKRLEYL